MMQALRLGETTTHLEPVTWAGGESLDALTSAVGGHVDVVQLTPSVSMWVNDEGAYLCRLNRHATRVTWLHGDTLVPIFGPVVFTGCRGVEHATVGLPGWASVWLHACLSGRCTSIVQRDGRAAACDGVAGHRTAGHEAIVDGARWTWNGTPAASMTSLDQDGTS